MVVEDPLYLRFTPEQEKIQRKAFVEVLNSNKRLTAREREQEMAEFAYRSYIRLPFPLHNWCIRPVWRDPLPTPPLSYRGTSGREYKPIRRGYDRWTYDIPPWEARSSRF
jgi:hypothetical protein